ncbi:hypothetical protein [Ramlibacter sp.]|uniref:hypothetical protein n=1 Tax=Ramlibacter sp. TaxID=1917967 RepID=UPI002C4F1DD1|nr:hypothetical protein [Ramlibacter sp.]HWI84189.1 hypothetical protein [Ramlibacter sp.]
MEKIIVYLDDASYAQQQLVPMRSGTPASAGTTHWVLVACAPRMTQRIGKWVSHSAREKWRAQWSAKLFARIEPVLQSGGDRVTTVLAKGPLPELTRKLLAQHGACRVLDARRPKFGQDLQPVTADQPASTEGRWQLPGAVASMGAALVLAAE